MTSDPPTDAPAEREAGRLTARARPARCPLPARYSQRFAERHEMQRTLEQSHDNSPEQHRPLRRRLTDALARHGAWPSAATVTCAGRTVDMSTIALLELVRLDVAHDEFEERLAARGCSRGVVAQIEQALDEQALDLVGGLGYLLFDLQDLLVRFYKLLVLNRSYRLGFDAELLERGRALLATSRRLTESDPMTEDLENRKLEDIERIIREGLSLDIDEIDKLDEIAIQLSDLYKHIGGSGDDEEQADADVVHNLESIRRNLRTLRRHHLKRRDARVPSACRAPRRHRHQRATRSHRRGVASIGKLAAGDPDPEPEPPTTRHIATIGGVP